MQVFIFIFVALSLCAHTIAAEDPVTLIPSPTPSPSDSFSPTEVQAVCAPSTSPTRVPTPHPSVHPSPRPTGSPFGNEGPSWAPTMRPTYIPSTSNPISALSPTGIKSELTGGRLAAIIILWLVVCVCCTIGVVRWKIILPLCLPFDVFEH